MVHTDLFILDLAFGLSGISSDTRCRHHLEPKKANPLMVLKISTARQLSLNLSILEKLNFNRAGNNFFYAIRLIGVAVVVNRLCQFCNNVLVALHDYRLLKHPLKYLRYN
jgi:hypothetical protein